MSRPGLRRLLVPLLVFLACAALAYLHARWKARGRLASAPVGATVAGRLGLDSIAVAGPAAGAGRVLFVTDRVAGRIEVHGERGLVEVGPRGGERLDHPNGIAVRRAASAWELLVVESGAGRVRRLRWPGWEDLGTLGEGTLVRPMGISIEAEGDAILVTDTARAGGRVVEIALADGIARVLCATGSTDIEGIAVAGCEILVCDEDGRAILRFRRRDGAPLGSVGEGVFQGEPEGIAVVRDAIIVVADQMPDTEVELFTRAGSGWAHAGSIRTSPALADVDGITLAGEELLAVCGDREIRAVDLGGVLEAFRGGTGP